MKPLALASHLDDRDWLAQVEAVDAFMDQMHAYPGRTMGQLYHRFFRVNELAEGTLDLGDEDAIGLADVRVPVLSIAGAADVLAPQHAVHHLAKLLPNAPQVRIETAPGGHLGVLTGRSAARSTWAWIDDFFADGAPEDNAAHLRVVPTSALRRGSRGDLTPPAFGGLCLGHSSPLAFGVIHPRSLAPGAVADGSGSLVVSRRLVSGVERP